MRDSTVARLTCATALGAAVTAAVLLLMQSLIENEAASLEEHPQGATLAFLPVIEPQAPERDRRRPDPPPDPVTPPPPPPRVIDPGPEVVTGFSEMIPPDAEDPTGPMGFGLVDGEALSVVKVQPVYPARAQQQGIEGYVLVQFTIDELGRVVDVQVVEAEPRGMFERAALKAVERFRYKPRVLNGEPIPVTGVQHLVTFELSS